MAKHIYMSIGAKQPNGKYMRRDRMTGQLVDEDYTMRYRGEVEDDHDTDNHAFWMGLKGHLVMVFPTIVGKKNGNHIEFDLREPPK